MTSADPKPALSVVVVFYNMRREAKRTLYSLTERYQIHAASVPYEVIAVDSGSPQPLDESFVRSHGSNFRYAYVDSRYPSPCEALNYGARIARADQIMLCIDGARILSPGILYYSMLATRIRENPFIYTFSMHVGRKAQNLLVEESYSREDEDKLFNTVDWQQDGYRLYDISSPALSSKEGFFSKISESNCLTVSRRTLDELGGFDERFQSSGGGLANLDFFNRANEKQDVAPIMLLGEATFHQFHGGTATNVPMKDHPWPRMAEEYQAIRGMPYKLYEREPLYFGRVHPKCYNLLAAPAGK